MTCSSDTKENQTQSTTFSAAPDIVAEPPDKPPEHRPSNPTRRKSSIENLKMEEARADDQANTQWSTGVTRPGVFKRRSSSLSLDMRDGIIDFKDQDGKYASACNHCVLEDDHKCSCKSKSAAVRK